MTAEIIDLEYVADYGTVGTCLLCDEPIEHGQIRALVTAGNGQSWAHDYCAEPLNLGDPAEPRCRPEAARPTDWTR